jgi:hypothetical protein
MGYAQIHYEREVIRMGKYEKEFDANRVPIVDDLWDMLTGEIHTCDITNKETGEKARGAGHSKTEAEKDAWTKLHRR